MKMSKPPPTKQELDRLNARIKTLQAPQTPHMAPAPGGSMRQQATQVQIQARKQATEKLVVRRDEIAPRLDAVKGKSKEAFDREK
tara:strand:- start:855 stop:1109 length:255 start_codon:yes stop_codon:yes gene_type:complete